MLKIPAFAKRQNVTFNLTEMTAEQIKQHRTNLAEQGTDYAKNLAKVPSDFFEIYKYNISIYPPDSAYGDYNRLSRGTAILQTQQDLVLYNLFYAGTHYYKMKLLFQDFFNSQLNYLNNKTLEVIDYGCGQALASSCFLDYLNKNNLPIQIKGFRLLEPSNLALQRGILHINHLVSSQNPSVFIANNNLDNITETDLFTNNDTVKIHLFSNIIDVVGIDLTTLAQKIVNTQKGRNYFLCVSPDNYTASSRLESFAGLFGNKTEIPVSNATFKGNIYNTTKRQFEQRDVTRQQKVFYTDF